MGIISFVAWRGGIFGSGLYTTVVQFGSLPSDITL
jgi:hypothetical protein